MVALTRSTLQGNLIGEMQEKAFRDLLGVHDVVALGEDATYSVGRKWRNALIKMGFLAPDISAVEGADQAWIGPAYYVTKNGARLVAADSVAAWQECFLRALAAYFIPSVLEPRYATDYEVFSPLQHVIHVLLELEAQVGESRINFVEFALVLQLTSPAHGTKKTVAEILALRKRREESAAKRTFDTEAYGAAATAHGYVEQTFKDYADLNQRYLKATGLFLSKGKGISLAPDKRVLAAQVADFIRQPKDLKTQLLRITEGAALPTDLVDPALQVLKDLLGRLEARGVKFSIVGRPLKTAQDIGAVRHDAEEALAKSHELDFAARQAGEWQEIASYLDLMIRRRDRATMENGEEISIPRSEAPAYFEWVMWRAFLAINKLVTPPYASRRFKVDQDFLPVSCAPGGGPDLIMEFKEFVLGVEVTFTESSRQEAAEGESVRRHIAQLAESFAGIKPVYGLFSARKIDSNTAETFRTGVWYRQDDHRTTVDIVPLTIEQFRNFFEALFRSGNVDNRLVKALIDQCMVDRELDAPGWKAAIDSRVTTVIAGLTSKP